MSAVAITGSCVVLPKKNGQRTVMPPGFRSGVSYRVLSGFFPNGSTDLHLFVVADGGKIVPLMYSDVAMTVDGGSSKKTYSFPNALRVWSTRVDALSSSGWAETCMDLNGRKMLPHRVTWDTTFENVTIEWTRPVAGHLLLG